MDGLFFKLNSPATPRELNETISCGETLFPQQRHCVKCVQHVEPRLFLACRGTTSRSSIQDLLVISALHLDTFLTWFMKQAGVPPEQPQPGGFVLMSGSEADGHGDEYRLYSESFWICARHFRLSVAQWRSTTIRHDAEIFTSSVIR